MSKIIMKSKTPAIYQRIALIIAALLSWIITIITLFMISFGTAFDAGHTPINLWSITADLFIMALVTLSVLLSVKVKNPRLLTRLTYGVFIVCALLLIGVLSIK